MDGYGEFFGKLLENRFRWWTVELDIGCFDLRFDFLKGQNERSLPLKHLHQNPEVGFFDENGSVKLVQRRFFGK